MKETIVLKEVEFRALLSVLKIKNQMFGNIAPCDTDERDYITGVFGLVKKGILENRKDRLSAAFLYEEDETENHHKKADEIGNTLQLAPKASFLKTLNDAGRILELSRKGRITEQIAFDGHCLYIRVTGDLFKNYHLSYHESIADCLLETPELLREAVSDDILYDGKDITDEHIYDIDRFKEDAEAMILCRNAVGAQKESIYLVRRPVRDILIDGEKCFFYSKAKLLEILCERLGIEDGKD